MKKKFISAIAILALDLIAENEIKINQIKKKEEQKEIKKITLDEKVKNKETETHFCLQEKKAPRIVEQKKTAKKAFLDKTIKPESVSTTTRNIVLNSEITDKTITYEKHWYKPYPSDFKISINDQEYMSLQDGKTKIHEKAFTIVKNKIKVTYEWALNKFGKLWHTEKKEIEFEVPSDRDELTMKFSWENDNRISIDNAKMIMCANLDQTKKPI